MIGPALKSGLPGILTIVILLQVGIVPADAKSLFEVAKTDACERTWFERFSSQQGLSLSRVNGIAQDRKGFLWFATDDGLNKFDAYRFEVFKHTPYNTHSALNSAITLVREGPDGRIWIVYRDNSLGSLDRRSGRFRTYTRPAEDIGFSSEKGIEDMAADGDNSMWFLSNDGTVFRCLAGEDTLRFFQSLKQEKKSGDVQLHYSPGNGKLWCSFNDRLFVRDSVSGAFRQLAKLPGSLQHNGIRALCQDDYGTLWVGTLRHLYTWDAQRTELRLQTPMPGNYDDPQTRSNLLCMAFDADGHLWIGTTRGLFVLNPQNGQICSLNNNIGTPGRENRMYISALHRDNSDNMWVATGNYGLLKVPPATSVFRHYGRKDNSGLQNNLVRAIFEDAAGILWLGTQTGLYRSIGNERHSFEACPELAPRSNLQAAVNAIAQDSTGNIWIGYTGDDAVVYQPETGHARFFPTVGTKQGLKGKVYSLHVDEGGYVWLGTNAGLARYKAQTDSFTHYPLPQPTENPQATSVIFDVYTAADGMIWVAASAGLHVFDTAQGQFTEAYYYDNEDSTTISGKSILCIYSFGDDHLWLATYGGGLNRFDLQTRTFHCYTERDGLANNAVFGILGDSRGNLWLSTNNGLCRFSPATETFRNFDTREGLQDKEFFFGAYFHNSRSGEMMFGGVNGFNIFHPDSIRDNNFVPPLALTRFAVFDTLRHNELFDGDSVCLNYDENFISFEFSALDYRNPGQNSYAYKLEGVDEEWIYCGRRRYAAYTDLRGGSYTLRVKGSNNAGVWNKKGIAVFIDIAPPYWDTVWFRASAVIMISLLAFGLVRRRIRTVQTRETLRRKQVESELQVLRLQLNPHFIFNSLATIQNMILDRDPESASEILGQFARFMRRLLEHSRREKVSLSEELHTLDNYLQLQALRFDGTLHWDIRVEEGIDSESLMVPALVLQPYVENSIVHGLAAKKGKRYMRIEVLQRNENLVCAVEDNGIGREQAGRRRRQYNAPSIGMQVARERLSLLSKQTRRQFEVDIIDLFSECGGAAGTRVEVTLARL